MEDKAVRFISNLGQALYEIIDILRFMFYE